MRQVDLAERAKVGPTRLSAIEGDADYCGDMTAARIAAALGVPIEAFTDPGPHPNLHRWSYHRRRAA